MIFTSQVTPGHCRYCSLVFENESMIHEEEVHPIHRRCLEIWVKLCRQRKQESTCPICHKNIQSIECARDALVRMAGEGNEVAVTIFIRDFSFYPMTYNLAVCAAAKNDNNYDKIVTALLETGKVEDEYRNMALVGATRSGNINTFKVLNYNGVPESVLKTCLKIAERGKGKGYEEILREIQPGKIRKTRSARFFNKLNPTRYQLFV